MGACSGDVETDGAKAIHTGGSIIHEVGGAIMGAEARSSVTNKWCQTWDVANVFITDGAPFPSNADKNPTLTIMANAWRVCDHILDAHAPQGDLMDRRTTIKWVLAAAGGDGRPAADVHALESRLRCTRHTCETEATEPIQTCSRSTSLANCGR